MKGIDKNSLNVLMEMFAERIADSISEKVCSMLFAQIEQHRQIHTQTKKDDDLLTSTEVCEILKISRPTLQRHIKTGALHIVKKIGKKNYFSRNSLKSH
jgi:excisionase family DNA binding protein